MKLTPCEDEINTIIRYQFYIADNIHVSYSNQLTQTWLIMLNHGNNSFLRMRNTQTGITIIMARPLLLPLLRRFRHMHRYHIMMWLHQQRQLLPHRLITILDTFLLRLIHQRPIHILQVLCHRQSQVLLYIIKISYQDKLDFNSGKSRK